MAFNDENCPPSQGELNISVDSIKAGAAVFGNIVFGSEYPDHSLTYSPSPLLNRRNNENIQEPTSPSVALSSTEPKKALNFEKYGISPKKRKGKLPHKKMASVKSQSCYKAASSRDIPKTKATIEMLHTSSNSKAHCAQSSQPGSSVNPVINNLRRSKEQNLKQRILSVAELRDKRRAEKEEAEAFNAEAEKTRREVLLLRKQLSHRFQRAKAERERKLREEQLIKVDEEIEFKSKVHVEHKRTIKAIEDNRRRISIDDREKLRKNHREGKERMKLASIEEEQALFEERHESSVAMRNTKQHNAHQRRQSFAFRNGDARRIRELHAQMEADKLKCQHESYELKWAGERDAEKYKKQMEKSKRESLAFRNAEGRRIRDLEAQMKADDQHSMHESYELKWDGERDADEHRKQMEKERRESFASRNADGKRIRDLEAQMKAADLRNEHESYELKWDGDRDAEEHKNQMAKERRESLAFRNEEGRRIRELEAQMKADDQQNENKSYELKWDGERDVVEYKKQMAKERRDSLALRNAEGKRIRDLEAQMKADEQRSEHESYELKWDGERDADEHRKQMAKERRESLAFRNAEGRRIREFEAQMKTADLRSEHESYELKWDGDRDAEEHKKQMAKERRDSFAYRNGEGRRIRELEAQMKADEQQSEHESYELKWAGERDAYEYKRQMAKEKRESFASRNAEGKRIRDLEAQMKLDGQLEEHASYELKWAGERDADEHRKLMAKERRESLAFRNSEAARHDAVMKELLSIAREKEHESYVLKWAGENDAKRYMAEQKDLQRRSLAFRNAEGKRHREIDEKIKNDLVLENARNEEINAACQRDVDNYKAECSARDRASLCLRGKEHFATRMKLENDRQTRLQEDHESHILDTAAWQDVNDYVNECNRRRRLSLVSRAKEKRRHFEYERKQAEKELQQRHCDSLYRSEDARYIEMAKLKEKARVALESFKRSPNCTFGPNPFATILE